MYFHQYLFWVMFYLDFFLFSEKVETGVKRKSVSADNGDAAEKTTPEKKAKVADESPAEAEEAAA